MSTWTRYARRFAPPDTRSVNLNPKVRPRSWRWKARRGFATIGAANDQGDGSLGELLALYVDPDHWGLGIGRRLMFAARRLLTERGLRQAMLWVLEGNERAERFYRADSWLPDGTHRQIEVWGVMADEVRYRRNLP